MKQVVLDPAEKCSYDLKITYTPENTMWIDLSGVKPTGRLGGLDHWDAAIQLSGTFPGNIPLDHSVTREGVLSITIRFTHDGALVDAAVFPRRGYLGGVQHAGWEELSRLSGIRIRGGRLYYVYRDGSEEERLVFIKPELVYGYNRLSATICVRIGGYVAPFTGRITIVYDDTPPERIPSIEYVGMRLAGIDRCRLEGDYWVCSGVAGKIRVPVHIVFSGKARSGFPVKIMVFRDEGWSPGRGAYNTVKPVLLYEETVAVPAGRDSVDTEIVVDTGDSPLVVFASYLWWDSIAWGRWSEHVVLRRGGAPVVGELYGGVFNTLRARCCGELMISGDYPYIVYRIVSGSMDTGYVRASGSISIPCSGESSIQLYVPPSTTNIYIGSCGVKRIYRIVSGRENPYLYGLALVRSSNGYVLEIAYGSKIPRDTYAVIEKWVDGTYLGMDKVLVPAGTLVLYHSIGLVSGHVKLCVTSTGRTMCLEEELAHGKPGAPGKPTGGASKPSVPVIPLPSIPSAPRNIPQKEFLLRSALLVLGSTALIIPLAEVAVNHD